MDSEHEDAGAHVRVKILEIASPDVGAPGGVGWPGSETTGIST
jgi:hypothetical protein